MREVGLIAGLLHREVGRRWLLSGLSGAPALLPPWTECALLSLFQAPMGKRGTEQERQRQVRMAEWKIRGEGGKQGAQHVRMCWEGIRPPAQVFAFVITYLALAFISSNTRTC